MRNIVETRREGVINIVTAKGEFDLSNVAVLREAMKDLIHERELLILDMTWVSFADSSVIGAVVGAHKEAIALSGDLRLVLPPGPVRKVFDITGVTHAVNVYDNLSDAQADPRLATRDKSSGEQRAIESE